MPDRHLDKDIGLPSTLKGLCSALENRLAQANLLGNPVQDARYMVFKRTGLSWADCLSSPDRLIDSVVLKSIQNDLIEALSGKPLSRIYGERDFYGRIFEISAETLDPRIDTEALVDVVLNRFNALGVEPEMILDLGTGSGCILLSLLAEFKGARGVGVDRSFGALQTARSNAQKFGLEDRVSFLCGNWSDSLAGNFDLVVSNPPYITNRVIADLDESVRKFDPILALDGGDDGMDAYRAIFLQIPTLLKRGGWAAFEIGFDQRQSVERLSSESGFLNSSFHLDSGGLPRVLEFQFEQ